MCVPILVVPLSSVFVTQAQVTSNFIGQSLYPFIGDAITS